MSAIHMDEAVEATECTPMGLTRGSRGLQDLQRIVSSSLENDGGPLLGTVKFDGGVLESEHHVSCDAKDGIEVFE
eukprot:scaffold243158_cov19-Prasinocladus_malaysianus.AAC.1